MAYALVMTPEVRAWLHDLRRNDRTSAILVGQAIGMLIEAAQNSDGHWPTVFITRG
ncbi:MAG TPA: hypothetical protein VFQ44_25225 [Streptosporangiaceae bacterium]|nr:hypothetical protein [Streptosporangiaceae bacterium]